MLTDTHSVVSTLTSLPESSTVVVSLGEPGLRTWAVKVGQADYQAFWTFWLISFVKICKYCKVFLKRHVKDSNMFGVAPLKFSLDYLDSAYTNVTFFTGDVFVF